jgi:hypothetical protein
MAVSSVVGSQFFRPLFRVRHRRGARSRELAAYMSVGLCDEQSHCRCGMWFERRRMLCIHPRFSQVIAAEKRHYASIPYQRAPRLRFQGRAVARRVSLTLEVAELSATFAHKGYQPQTIAARSEKSESFFAPPRFVPNPVHADLHPVGASAKRQQRKETPVAAENPPGAISVEATASSNAPANSASWSYGDVK